MLRRGLATSSPQVTSVDPPMLIGAQARAVRVSHRMVIDTLALLDVGIVILSAALAKVLYIAVFLDTEQLHEPYIVAGLAGGVILHYIIRARGLLEASAIDGWSKGIERAARYSSAWRFWS